MTKRIEAKNWCFTSFNMDIDWEHLFIEEIDKKQSVNYCVYQGEYTKDDRKHIQGFIQFKTKKLMTYVKKLFNDDTLHLEPMSKHSTPLQASDYCKKQEKDGVIQRTFFTYIEYGILDNTISGTRTDLIELRNRIIEGETLNTIMMTTTEDKTLNMCLQYNRPLRELQHNIHQEHQRAKILEDYTDYKWNKEQQHIINIINEELHTSHKRRINWIYDEHGNIGKTQLARYYIAQGNTYYITGGKQADILYSYEGQPIVIYDLARTYSDNLDHIYTTIENLKNGCYLSTKYNSQQRIYSKQPIIIVLTNFLPDTTKLSIDRWNIISFKSPNHSDNITIQKTDCDNVDEITDKLNTLIDCKYSQAPSINKHLKNKLQTIIQSISQE